MPMERHMRRWNFVCEWDVSEIYDAANAALEEDMNLQLGKRQVLTVEKQVDFGVYLGTAKEHVLLPARQVPEGLEPGDPVEVFLYKDSKDRLIATTHTPLLELGGLAVLEVVDVNKMGAFLDWGLEKDLFLPYRQQTAKVQKGDSCLVSLYIDKSERLCATMKVYHELSQDSPYKEGDHVSGIIYDTSKEFGVFVAVDNKYSALIPNREAFGSLKVGETVQGRIVKVRDDGKLTLSVREKIPEQMEKDALFILKELDRRGGVLPFTDKADAERIKKELGLSKNAFKRAVGRLLKHGEIEITEKSIRLK